MFKARNIAFGILIVFFFTLVLVFLSSRPIPTKKPMISDSTPEGYIKAEVKDLQISASGGVISIGGDESEKVLQIHIGMDQAHTLVRVMNNLSSKRPMTHDLLDEILKKSGTDIVYISVDKFEAGTFFATIVVRDGEVKKLDARPSDSIIIALMRGAPIYVKKDLLEVSGVAPGQKEVQREVARSV
ncbi:MAG: bifunctional nuclease family protein [Candidatus Hydrothermarchaeales archaeon]